MLEAGPARPPPTTMALSCSLCLSLGRALPFYELCRADPCLALGMAFTALYRNLEEDARLPVPVAVWVRPVTDGNIILLLAAFVALEILNSGGSLPVSLSRRYRLLACSKFFWLKLGPPSNPAYIIFGGPGMILSGSMKLLFFTVRGWPTDE